MHSQDSWLPYILAANKYCSTSLSLGKTLAARNTPRMPHTSLAAKHPARPVSPKVCMCGIHSTRVLNISPAGTRINTLSLATQVLLHVDAHACCGLLLNIHHTSSRTTHAHSTCTCTHAHLQKNTPLCSTSCCCCTIDAQVDPANGRQPLSGCPYCTVASAHKYCHSNNSNNHARYTSYSTAAQYTRHIG
jgi:hypothetical protein